MMKPLLHSALFFYLLIVLAHAAGAEDAALKTQTSTNISSSAVVAKTEAKSSQTVVVGNKDTKRYHLAGMPYYNKVKKVHRIYFNSEQEAIDKGYYKAGTGKDLTGKASAVVAKKEDIPSLTAVVGNKDTKRYHLAGMPYYNKVKKVHRVYFNSEQEAIDKGYYKAGTVKNSTGAATQNKEPIKEQAIPAAAAPSLLEKSSPAALSKNEKILETKTQDTPPTVSKETVIEAPVKPPSPMAGVTDTSVAPKVELEQKSSTATAQDGVFLKREGNTLQLDQIVLNKERPRRIEASYSFDYLRPNDTYGNWNSGQLAFYHTLTPEFTYFVMGTLMNRNEGTGGTGTVGAYVGWTSFLYTCTSVTAGTNSAFTPQFRFDHDFNFAVWPSKGINFLTGISYIDSFDDHSGLIFSGGPMITYEKWNLHYRLFYNISNPGSISSFSHLISLGYGEEGWQWTHLNVSFGKQAYLATFTAVPQNVNPPPTPNPNDPYEVNQNSLWIDLQHRHWLGKHYGIFGDVSYFKLDEGYEKYGIGLGAFYEF